jgi:hypothetical protein
MNEYIKFWRAWDLKDKAPLFATAFIALLLAAYAGFAWFNGLENILEWNTVSEMHQKVINETIFGDHKLSFSASTPLWYIKEHYLPSLVEVNRNAYYLLLIGGLLGLVTILSGTARLKGLWFLVAAIFLAGVLVSMRLENVLDANNSYGFLVSFIVFGGFYYVSNLFNQKLKLYQTLSIWLIIVALFLFVVQAVSQINTPFLSISAYSLIAFLAITLVFIFLISHEIFAGLVWLVSKNARKDQSSLSQLFIISAVYLANVILIYLENTRIIESSTYVVPPLLLYFTSAILGIWGFRKLLDQQQLFSFNRSGVWIYIGLAIVSSSCIAFIYATANDPLQEFIEDYIAITQLAVGFTFFIYILINYFQLFKQGLDVQKVMYKSPYSRLILTRVASIFLIILLFASKNYYSYYQVNAGYDNAIADFYLEEGDLKAAETFYKSSTHYDLYNHKANVTLASLALSQKDRINAAFFFKQAIFKNPSAYAYAGLSASLETEDMYFDALFSLQEGLKTFPNEHRLLTDLAFLQQKSNLTDSVLYYLDLAKKTCTDCEVENTNFLAFWIENSKPERLEEMTAELVSVDSKSQSSEANKKAVARLLNKPISLEVFEISKDSVLDVSRAANLFNSVASTQPESVVNIDPLLFRKLQQKEGNEPYFEELSLTYAQNQYYRGNKIEGLKQMTLLGNNSLSKNKPLYNQNLGLWLLNEGVYTQAIERLNMAGDSASATILSKPSFKAELGAKVASQAKGILKEKITKENFESIKNKAPLNPIVTAALSDYLSSTGNDVKAYNLPFYVAELNPDAALLWKTYIKKAIKLAQFDYASNGLEKLKKLVGPSEYQEFAELIAKSKDSQSSDGFQ